MTKDRAIIAAINAASAHQFTLSIDAFYASLAASGFAVVPVEATDEMLEALVDKGLEVDGYTRSLQIGDMQAGYRAMLAAALKEQNDA